MPVWHGILGPAGPYAEAAHIRALGRAHNGPDVEGNVLCLCPNHHVLFDASAIIVEDNEQVRETATWRVLGPLRIAGGHAIDWNQVTYHRAAHQPDPRRDATCSPPACRSTPG